MKITIDDQLMYAIVSHKNSNIFFEFRTYKSGIPLTPCAIGERGNEPTGIFHFTNRLLAELDEETQDKVFECYQEFDAHLTLMRESTNQEAFDEAIKKTTAKLYSLFDIAEVNRWLRFASGFHIPPDIPMGYDADDRNPDKTYIFEDYIQLAGMATLVRLMAPVWSVYIAHIAASYDNQTKIIVACRLLAESSIWTCPAMDRLVRYIASNRPAKVDERVLLNGALNGVSSTELPTWARAQIVVKRLVYQTLTGNGKRHLISDIYSSVIMDLYKKSRNPIGPIMSKVKQASGSGGAEDERGVSEVFDSTQLYSDGDVVEVNISITDGWERSGHDLHPLVELIDPTVSPALLRICINNAKRVFGADNTRTPRYAIPVFGPNVTLAAWVMALPLALYDEDPDDRLKRLGRDGLKSPFMALPPRLLSVIDRPALCTVLGMAQALLFHWGYPRLAEIPTLKVVDGDSITGEVKLVRRVDNLQLTALYPAFPKTNTSGTNPKIRLAIDTIKEPLARLRWVRNSPTTILRKALEEEGVPMEEVKPNWTIPSDIRIQLSHLILKINGVEPSK